MRINQLFLLVQKPSWPQKSRSKSNLSFAALSGELSLFLRSRSRICEQLIYLIMISLSVRSQSLDNSLDSMSGFSLSQLLLLFKTSSKLIPLSDKNSPGPRVGYRMKCGMTLYLYSQMIKSLRYNLAFASGTLVPYFSIVIQMFLPCLNSSTSGDLLS